METKTKVKVISNADLNKLVIAEAKALRKNARPIELKRLDFGSLDSNHVERCIYGQMTGECFSKRASILIGKSCERVIKPITRYGGVDGILNGSPKEFKVVRDMFTGVTHWSPIEVFIARKRNQRNGNIKRLVAYLKGETKTLNIK